MPELTEKKVCRFEDLAEKTCREFSIGEGDWPLRGFVVRRGDSVHAYQNYCSHVGHPLNWQPDSFLTKKRDAIICASHGALYEIETGRCLGGPCRGKPLRKIEAFVRDGVIWVRGPDSM